MLPCSVLRSGKALLDREERSKGRHHRGESGVGVGRWTMGLPFISSKDWLFMEVCFLVFLFCFVL